MANKDSAKKAMRHSERARIFNLRRKRAMKSAIKELLLLVSAGKKQEAVKLLPKVYKVIDKAAKRGVIKKNTASRKKSRLTKHVEKISV